MISHSTSEGKKHQPGIKKNKCELIVISSSYVYVLLNDFFTAGNGVLTKKKLESKDLGKYGVIFYNAMFMLGPAIIFAWQTGDIDAVMGEETTLPKSASSYFHNICFRVRGLV